MCRSSLLERMPVLDEANYLVKRAASTQATVSSVKSAPAVIPGGQPKLPNGVAKPPAAPLADLLDLSSDDTPVTTSAPTTAPNDFLQDLLGIDLTDSSPAGLTLGYLSFIRICSFSSWFAQENQVMIYRIFIIFGHTVHTWF